MARASRKQSYRPLSSADRQRGGRLLHRPTHQTSSTTSSGSLVTAIARVLAAPRESCASHTSQSVPNQGEMTLEDGRVKDALARQYQDNMALRCCRTLATFDHGPSQSPWSVAHAEFLFGILYMRHPSDFLFVNKKKTFSRGCGLTRRWSRRYFRTDAPLSICCISL